MLAHRPEAENVIETMKEQGRGKKKEEEQKRRQKGEKMHNGKKKGSEKEMGKTNRVPQLLSLKEL